jgi:hypothetical protein
MWADGEEESVLVAIEGTLAPALLGGTRGELLEEIIEAGEDELEEEEGTEFEREEMAHWQTREEGTREEQAMDGLHRPSPRMKPNGKPKAEGRSVGFSHPSWLMLSRPACAGQEGADLCFTRRQPRPPSPTQH